MAQKPSLESMEIKKVLVTGDRGYIGSTLVPLLLKNGYKVVGYDTEFFQKTLTKSSIKYKKINKDIRKLEKSDLKGIDAVIHLAALSNDPMGALDPKLTEEINYNASIRLAKMAKEIGVRRFIFSSSCSIYGIAKNGIVNEKSLVKPITEYAKSKIKVEDQLRRMADESFTVGILRNSTVYGLSPKFRADLVVNDLTLNALLTKQIKVLSDGTPWRPLIDVRDLANIFSIFLKKDSKLINGEIFNIGFSKSNYQIKDIANAINNILGHEISYPTDKGVDSRSYKVNFKKFEKAFPEAKQKWPPDKSISDLSKALKKVTKNKKFHREDYVRLFVLKKLIEEKKISKRLYWI